MENLKAGGFVIEGNPFSTYCLVAPLSSKGKVKDKNFKDVFAFILFYSDKHLQAGLPVGSVIGDTLRRLLISLARSPKVEKVIFVEAKNVRDESDSILRHIKEVFEKGNVDEAVRKRGRFNEYTEEIIDLVKDRIVEFEKISIDDLEKKREDIVDIIYNNFELPERKNLDYLPEKFRLLKPSIEAYSPPAEEDLYSIKKFESVHEAYDYCVKIVKHFGKLYPDSSGLLRYEVKIPYVHIALEKWDDLDKFLEKVGIQRDIEEFEFENQENDVTRIFGKFGKRVKSSTHKREHPDFSRLDEFKCSLTGAVNSERLNFSRDLDLVSEKETPDGTVQIGWSKTKVSLDKENETILLAFHHILRSIDAHNGLPYNLYHCIKASEYITNEIVKNCEKDVKMRTIFISLGNLHAYYDNVKRDEL